MEFVKGVRVRQVKTPYGFIIKVGLKIDEISKLTNSQGYVNLDIKKSQKGNFYASLDEYVPPKKDDNNDYNKSFPTDPFPTGE